MNVRGLCQILLHMLNEFKQIKYLQWNHQKTICFFMISGGIEVNSIV